MTIIKPFMTAVFVLAALGVSVPAGAFSFSGDERGVSVNGSNGKISVDSQGKTKVEPKAQSTQTQSSAPAKRYITKRQNVTTSRSTQRSNVIVKRDGETVLREGESASKYFGQSGKSPFKGKLKTGGKGASKTKSYSFNQ